jgi:alkaline phosphatase
VLNDITGVFRRVFTVITSLLLMIAGIGGIGSSPNEPKVKNVILFIGDGMGENHLEWTKEELGVDLVLDTLPIQGYSETADYLGLVTDSAAGATALACGVRAISGSIGVYPSDLLGVFSYPMSLSELAIEKGMKAGIVTSDSTSGATPAGFSAHTKSRDDERPITLQQLRSEIDLIWGAPTDSGTNKNISESNGFSLVTSLDDVDALPEGAKSFGQFPGKLWGLENEEGSTLSDLTAKAISLLDGEEGFFLMVEGAHIDKNSHANNKEGMMEAVQEFDKTLQVALDFAQADGETLIVVTADHETGAIKKTNGQFGFTSGSHSGVNVPLRVYGVESFIETGASMKNRMIPVYIADKLGCEKDEFPRQIYATAFEF